MDRKKERVKMPNEANSYEFILAGDVKSEVVKNIKLNDYYNFNKIYTREFENKDSRKKVKSLTKDFTQLKGRFTFMKGNYLDKKYQNLNLAEFPFFYMKDDIITSKNKKLKFTNDKSLIEDYSGLIKIEDCGGYLAQLPPYSFILMAEIKLKAPYFSRDDEPLYLIDNPVLKEKVFKVPMVNGSSWKGILATAGKQLVNDSIDNFLPYARIWGLGSSEYRSLLEYLDDSKQNPDELRSRIIRFSLWELGLSLDKDDITLIKNNPCEFLQKLSTNLTAQNVRNKNLLPYLQPHKGRALFYPTFFDSISYEVINPHDRSRRAGINPIYYEVVPSGTIGKLQIIYIPYDALLTEDSILKEQVGKDLRFLCQSMDKAAELGIGAKAKLGWGRFELTEKKYGIQGKDIEVEGWTKC